MRVFVGDGVIFARGSSSSSWGRIIRILFDGSIAHGSSSASLHVSRLNSQGAPGALSVVVRSVAMRFEPLQTPFTDDSGVSGVCGAFFAVMAIVGVIFVKNATTPVTSSRTPVLFQEMRMEQVERNGAVAAAWAPMPKMQILLVPSKCEFRCE